MRLILKLKKVQMKAVYDENENLIGWRHSLEEAICKLCRISIYSMDCPHTDPELIELVPEETR